MKQINGEQTCYRCRRKLSSKLFYSKGNRFINCQDCRSQRENKKIELKILLQKEREEQLL